MNDKALISDLEHSARNHRDRWLQEHGFTYVMGTGSGFLEACRDCGAVVAVPHTRDVLKDLIHARAHVKWHKKDEPEPEPKEYAEYLPPGVYV